MLRFAFQTGLDLLDDSWMDDRVYAVKNIKTFLVYDVESWLQLLVSPLSIKIGLRQLSD